MNFIGHRFSSVPKINADHSDNILVTGDQAYLSLQPHSVHNSTWELSVGQDRQPSIEFFERIKKRKELHSIRESKSSYFGGCRGHDSPYSQILEPDTSVCKLEKMQGFKFDCMVSPEIPATTVAIKNEKNISSPHLNPTSLKYEELDLENLPSTLALHSEMRLSMSVTNEATLTTSASTAKERKRRATRKRHGLGADDDKRQQSLEKNKHAAAKCRATKKEMTARLLRESHDKVVYNALLKEQLIGMDQQLQELINVLLVHTGYEGCRAPEEIQRYLTKLGSEYFAKQMQSANHDEILQAHDHEGCSDYFAYTHTTQSSTVEALPRFEGDPNFEVLTPMQSC
jgi:hypothetical protein